MTTRLQIVDRARQKANMESSSFVDTAAPLFVQEAYEEVYHLFATKGLQMVETDVTLTLSATIALPTDFYAAIAIWHSDGGQMRKLKRVQPDTEGAARSHTGNEGYWYKIITTAANVKNLKLYPVPTSGTYILQYVPVCPTLSADSTVLITVGCSDALVACILAKKFLAREQESNDGLDNECGRLLEEVNRQAEAVEMTQSATVQDVTNGGWDSFSYRIWGSGDDY